MYSVRMSQRAEDCLGYHMKRLVSYGKGQHTTDFIFATRLVGNSTWRPIWDYTIATEHTRSCPGGGADRGAAARSKADQDRLPRTPAG